MSKHRPKRRPKRRPKIKVGAGVLALGVLLVFLISFVIEAQPPFEPPGGSEAGLSGNPNIAVRAAERRPVLNLVSDEIQTSVQGEHYVFEGESLLGVFSRQATLDQYARNGRGTRFLLLSEADARTYLDTPQARIALAAVPTEVDGVEVSVGDARALALDLIQAIAQTELDDVVDGKSPELKAAEARFLQFLASEGLEPGPDRRIDAQDLAALLRAWDRGNLPDQVKTTRAVRYIMLSRQVQLLGGSETGPFS